MMLGKGIAELRYPPSQSLDLCRCRNNTFVVIFFLTSSHTADCGEAVNVCCLWHGSISRYWNTRCSLIYKDGLEWPLCAGRLYYEWVPLATECNLCEFRLECNNVLRLQNSRHESQPPEFQESHLALDAPTQHWFQRPRVHWECGSKFTTQCSVWLKAHNLRLLQ